MNESKIENGQPTLQQHNVMHWVAVSERLPNDYQRVLVGRAGEANVIKVLTYKKEFDNKHWGDSMESHFASPTHWMPLPEPPCA